MQIHTILESSVSEGPITLYYGCVQSALAQVFCECRQGILPSLRITSNHRLNGLVNCSQLYRYREQTKARNTQIGQRGECTCSLRLRNRALGGEVKKSEARNVENAQTKKELGMMNALLRTWPSLWPSWGEGFR